MAQSLSRFERRGVVLNLPSFGTDRDLLELSDDGCPDGVLNLPCFGTD